MNKSLGSWLLIALAVAAYGAYVLWRGQPELRTDYGFSYSYKGTRSINGVAAFRRMFEIRGWDTRTIKRLSRIAQRQDAIAWFPDAEQVPDEEATEWFDQWLADAPRTLVFVGHGYGSAEQEYWQRAAADALPEDRLEYRRRQARRAVMPERHWLGAAGEAYTNGWFTLEFRHQYSEARGLAGPWARRIDPPPQRVVSQAIVRPFDPDKDSDLTAGTFKSAAVQRDKAPPEFEPLLKSASGDVLAARLQSDLWPDSQVIVLSSAECLLNLSLADSANRALADQLIRQCGPPADIGFLRTDLHGARVSGGSDDELAAGMELLTQWPLSMTTMHMVLLGFVAILVLLPIFGRPRHLPAPSTGDFGDHVTAVAELLQRTGDTGYARARISEYFVQVRGEDSGPWVLPNRLTDNDERQGETR